MTLSQKLQNLLDQDPKETMQKVNDEYFQCFMCKQRVHRDLVTFINGKNEETVPFCDFCREKGD